uniref:Juvenile hormone esterase-like protein 1 n=1 Tax=Hirondellea gigas TaxID=1518452 RepID=A0A6A7G184_9CRUS
MKNGEHSKIDLLAGVTKDDGAYFSSMMYSSEKMITDLKDNFERMGPISLLLPDDVDLATQIYHHYFGQEMNFPEQADEFTDLMTDRFFKIPHYNVAQDHMQNVAGSGKRVYLYELRHRGQQSYLDRIPMPYLADPEVYEKWVCHADDLAYIFPGTPLFRQHENEVDQQLTRTVVKLWTNFAATGNPTPDASLGFIWEAAEEKRLRQLVLQQQPYMTDNIQQQAREFWSSLPLPENIRKHQHKFASGVEEFLEEITDTHFEL